MDTLKSNTFGPKSFGKKTSDKKLSDKYDIKEQARYQKMLKQIAILS